MRYLLLFLLVLGCACAACAYPTLTGPTGYAVLPSAEVAAPGELQLAADWYDTGSNSTESVRLVYGLPGNIEVGGEYEIDEGDYIAGLHGKFQLPVPIAGFKTAVGVVTVKGQGTTWDATQAYVAMTRPITALGIGTPLSMTVGANWTTVDDGIDDYNAVRLFGAIQCDITDKLSACAEYQTRSSDLGYDNNAMSAVAVRYQITPCLSGQVGYTNADEFFGYYDEHTLFAGLNYTARQ